MARLTAVCYSKLEKDFERGQIVRKIGTDTYAIICNRNGITRKLKVATLKSGNYAEWHYDNTELFDGEIILKNESSRKS